MRAGRKRRTKFAVAAIAAEVDEHIPAEQKHCEDAGYLHDARNNEAYS